VTFPFLADAAAPAFQLFREPLPVWDYWYLLLIPHCVGISIVYKAIKCRDVQQVPKEAAVICTVILVGMVVAATALYALMRALEQH
jgi:hypothetical protein